MSGRKLGGPIRRDSGLQKVVDGVLEGCEYVLAVGEGASETVLYLGARHPNLECLACEPKSETFFEASDKASRLKNVYMHNASPSDFMKMIESDKPYLFSRDSLFIISAAGGGPERRVPQEVEFVSGRFQAAFLLVLGFKVPEREDFGVTTHRGRECSMKNLAPNLKGAEYTLYYPAYDVPGSKRRRLPGWGLFTLGRNAEYEFSDEIKEMLTKV
jgi:hypothetical protein